MAMNKIKLPFAGIIFLFIAFAFSSCNKQNQFDVTFFFPDAKTNGAIPRLVTAYGLKDKGIPLNGDSLLAFYDNLQKKYLGGVGVTGTMTIDDSNISFEPGFGSSTMGEGFVSFQVPINEITDVTSESFLVITKAVVVKTKNGNFTFQLPKAKHWYNPFKFEDEDIIKMIKEKMNK